MRRLRTSKRIKLIPVSPKERKRIMFLKSLITIILTLFLFSIAIGHDGPPDPRRVVHAQHGAYLSGLIKGVEIGGGYPSITIKEMVDGFISAWEDAQKAFISAAMSRTRQHLEKVRNFHLSGFFVRTETF